MTPTARYRFELEGRLQGVGFRPLVYRIADELGLAGWVHNTGRGVTLELQGDDGRIDAFEPRLRASLPAAAFLRRLQKQPLDIRNETGFRIVGSIDSGEASSAELPPDLAICGPCTKELFDPTNRRHLYPFIQCTDCGPRYSILRRLPFDRANTSMAEFPLCEECESEYRDPRDRRFHAQGISCARCGPSLFLTDPSGRILAEREAALKRVAGELREGRIVAILGVGGFQLFCDSRSDEAIARLRAAKGRESKPFALMAPGIEEARASCRVSLLEERLLLSQEAPIVLMERGNAADPGGGRVSRQVAPGMDLLGVMLPYTPLHRLLLRELGFPVVATSGNRSEEPICSEPREALRRLAGIADFFLAHDRKVVSSVDDSVVREIAGTGVVIRAGRGYAPLVLPLPEMEEGEDNPPELLAMGGQQKNTVALGRGGQIVLMPHLGDLGSIEASEAYERRINRLCELQGTRRPRPVRDFHPDYHSTRVALARDPRAVRIQHHEAHLLSCVAEHGIRGRALGVAWDGTGYGLDGTIWGGEFFLGSFQEGFSRVGHLRRFRLPGGEAGVREPWRSAVGVLHEVGLPVDPVCRSERESRNLGILLERGVSSPVTSSAGRLFDAVAALLGVRHRCSYEGQAAMELEALAARHRGVSREDPAYPARIVRGELTVLDWEPWIRGILEDRERGWEAGRIALRFHRSLAGAIVEYARQILGRQETRQVLLSGGCFQNRVLAEGVIAGLREEGFSPYWNQRVPINDGGISVGQIAGGRRVPVHSR